MAIPEDLLKQIEEGRADVFFLWDDIPAFKQSTTVNLWSK